MGIIAKANEIEYEIPAVGSYIARCYKMIDIGTQPAWNPEQRSQRKVLISWELLEDEDGSEYRMIDGRPFSVTQEYTISISSMANLRKAIDSWRGIAFTDEEAEGFDITRLLDTYCRIGITHKPSKDGSKQYPRVATISFTKKKPDPVNVSSWWSIGEPDMEKFDQLPDYIKEKINQAEEWQAEAEQVTEAMDATNDPFETELPLPIRSKKK